jgi:recombination DNA repair RAD52 pathway protein
MHYNSKMGKCGYLKVFIYKVGKINDSKKE